MQDNYLREFDAKIVDIEEGYVVLDRTSFYPEGGGQSGDCGNIEKDGLIYPVKNTIKDNDVVKHLIDDVSTIEIGDSIHGILDWDFRYECMRFHTAQHILSRYLQIHYELETVGNMIKPGESRADYTPIEEISEEMKREVENGVNDIITRNLNVDIRFMPRDEAIRFLTKWGYQKRYLEMVPTSVKTFRVLIIGDYDAASCAGTHVSSTSEIGLIRIGKTKNVGSGKRRIYFKLDKV